MLRYGIVGTGMMGQEHIRNLALVEGTQVAALCDPDPGMRHRARELVADDGTRLFSDHREMIAAEICDAFIVASPNDEHHPVLLDLIPAGKPILCEKPLCTTLAHCTEVIRLSRRHGTPVWVAMEYRYMPPVARLLEGLASDAAGEPRMMSVREHRFPFLEKVGNWNRFNRRTGGTLVEKCCHFWDLMRLVFRTDPVRVYASGAMDVNHLGEVYDGEKPDIIDNAYVVVDFAGGMRAMLDLCMFAEGSKWQETVTVTTPRLRFEARVPGPARFSRQAVPANGQFIVSDRESRKEIVEEITVDETLLGAGDHYGSTFFQHRRFRDLVAGRLPRPEVTLEDGRWSVAVGLAAEESRRTGNPVTLGDPP